MAINKDEIDKYIFDPENPKQCESYKLLLILAKKKETKSFFSPEFLQYFFADQVINEQFEEELWDKPDSYHLLTPIQKIELFKQTNSYNDLLDIVQKIEFKIDKILKYSFFNSLSDFYSDSDYGKESESISFLKKYIIKLDENYQLDNMFKNYLQIDYKEYNSNFILLSKNYLDILNADISKSSILITLEKNIDKFLEYNQNNIKPIFLKKIEDVDILLNVLEQDLKKEKQKNIPQENISTLNKISIKDFFSIKEITLNNLKDKKEIYIVGENGDGKTLLLQAISVGLKGTQEDGLKEFRAREDEYVIEIEDKEDCKNNFLAYGSSRNNSCQLKKDNRGYLTLFSGEYYLKSPTEWLQYLDYSEQKENNNVITVAEAKKLLQELLNSDIEIDINPDKVIFKEKKSEVSFAQLSAGYRSVITIICDIIARLSEKQQVETIKDFQGIVLIDEVELHLHPKWQYSFMNKLKETFPLIQFVVTTHSPTVLLGACEKAVFYKVYKENGETKISQPMRDIKNLMANNLSTSPLFDMTTARARNSDENIDTREDFISSKIHKIIKERVKGKKAIVEDEIEDIINQELDKFLKENNL